MGALQPGQAAKFVTGTSLRLPVPPPFARVHDPGKRCHAWIIAGMERAEALSRAGEALSLVGLDERAEHRVTTLSGGERQRAAIARAVLSGRNCFWPTNLPAIWTSTRFPGRRGPVAAQLGTGHDIGGGHPQPTAWPLSWAEGWNFTVENSMRGLKTTGGRPFLSSWLCWP